MKYGMQARHQKRCRHPLSRHITEDKIKLIVDWDHIEIITDDRAERFVNKIGFPRTMPKAHSGKKRALNARGKLEIAFKRTLLRFGQLVNTNSYKRVRQQAISAQIIAALFAL